jgi:hypothetical protein
MRYLTFIPISIVARMVPATELEPAKEVEVEFPGGASSTCEKLKSDSLQCAAAQEYMTRTMASI